MSVLNYKDLHPRFIGALLLFFFSFLTLPVVQAAQGSESGVAGRNALDDSVAGRVALHKKEEKAWKGPSSDKLSLSERGFGDLRNYKKDAKFNYQVTGRGPSLLDRFWNWLTRQLYFKPRLLKHSSPHSSFMNKPLQILAIIVLFIAICLIFGLMKYMPWYKDKSLKPAEEEDVKQDIHKPNFPSAIEEAETKEDFSLAIRLRYLHVLKTLNEQDRIQWTPEKTNSSYMAELSNSPLYQSFTFLTHCFDYTFYGAFSIKQEQYSRMVEAFTSFGKQLKR